jgi:hypothetical protein
MADSVLRSWAYDSDMRRLFLCFLLCLMPLRLWAGAWMPFSESGSHPPAVLATVSPAQHTEMPTAHDCHGTVAQTLTEAQAQPALSNTAFQQTDCHDDHCQLCGVCHQGLSLTAWPSVMPVLLAHPLPVSVSRVHLARTSAPLTKPPIS